MLGEGTEEGESNETAGFPTQRRKLPLMSTFRKIDAFLAGGPFAVAGASADRSKYGNKVLRCYLQNGRTVYPVNPRGGTVEGVACARSLDEISEPVHGLSIITPPFVTEQVVAEAVALGIRHLWMQPGAESDAAIALAESSGVSVIADGSCLLVVLGFRESA